MFGVTCFTCLAEVPAPYYSVEYTQVGIHDVHDFTIMEDWEGMNIFFNYYFLFLPDTLTNCACKRGCCASLLRNGHYKITSFSFPPLFWLLDFLQHQSSSELLLFLWCNSLHIFPTVSSFLIFKAAHDSDAIYHFWRKLKCFVSTQICWGRCKTTYTHTHTHIKNTQHQNWCTSR